MATETPGADYICDCASSVFQMQNESRRSRKPIIVIDSEVGRPEHGIEFHKGSAVAVICPEKGRCPITRT